jgi:ubiquinone biosynthesis protein COQ4
MMESSTFRPLEALRGVRGILADPTATEEAFRIIRAVDGGGIDRLYARFQATPRGRALLSERPRLLPVLKDQDGLRAMPEGSLGRAYLAFCDKEGINSGGLVDASDLEARALLDEELLYMADRMRDSHDLWHVVVGCRTDLGGELAILAFTTAQTESFGVGLLTLAGYARSYTLPADFGEEGRRLVRAAWARARNAEWLPIARWEELLPVPLEEVRSRLNLDVMPLYEPYYVEDIEAFAA